MHDLSNRFILKQFVGFQLLTFLLKLWSCSHNLQYLILDFVKAPPRQHDKVPILRVFTDDFVNELTRVIVYLKGLISLWVTTAIQDSRLDDSSDELLLIFDVNCGSILRTETAVELTNALIGRMLVVVEACDSPGPMGSRQQNSLQ